LNKAAPLSGEQAAVWRLLGFASDQITTELTTFSTWLLTGVGAALIFLVANMESIASYVHATAIRPSLLLAGISLLCGLSAQWLSTQVKTSLAASNSLIELITQELDPDVFIEAYAKGLIWPLRMQLRYKLRRAKPADLMQSIYTPAKHSQRHSIWVLLQLLCAVTAVVSLTLQIKV